MALVVSSAGEDKMARRSSFRGEKKPWMLQDYLRDDANSCSSNGFKSFPRRECCAAAVKNIAGKKKLPATPPAKRLSRTRTISSAIHRASMAVINAVKFLPFKSPAKVGGESKRILPRSFSKKLFKRSLWWKKKSSSSSKKGERKPAKKDAGEECDEIVRWIYSGVAGSEKYQPSDLSNDTAATNASTTTRNSNSDGWSEITFSSDNFTASTENDVVERREKISAEDKAEDVVEDGGGRGGIPAQEAVTKDVWQNEENEKEQFSPVSVMDFPDNDKDSASPFTLRTTRFKGSRDRLVKKLGGFETLAELGLQPINLEGLMSSTLDKDLAPELSIQSCATPTFIISSDSDDEDEEDGDDEVANSQENKEEKKAECLLKMVKSRMSITYPHKYELDIVLLDFFRENVMEKEENALLKAAEDWLNGRYDNLILAWEVKDKRQAYIRDMEEGERWPRENKLEKEEVANEVEVQVLAHLIEEMLHECY